MNWLKFYLLQRAEFCLEKLAAAQVYPVLPDFRSIQFLSRFTSSLLQSGLIKLNCLDGLELRLSELLVSNIYT